MSFWSRLWNKPDEEARATSRTLSESHVLHQPDESATLRQSLPGEGWNAPERRHRASVLDQGIHRRRRLDYPEAAAAFLSWLQAEDETGEIPRPRLDTLYAEHCEVEGLAMVPLNFLFQALSRHADKWERRVPRRDGRRQRVTTYDIPRRPSPASDSAGRTHGYEAEAQPNRRAA